MALSAEAISRLRINFASSSLANELVDIIDAATAELATIDLTDVTPLLDGSNADSLHTHSAVESSQVAKAGLTTTGLADGDFGYISAAKTISKIDSAAIGTARIFGANEGVVGSMTVAGVIENAKFTTDGGSPVNGKPVFLANAADDTGTGAGKLTATAPSTGVLAEVGICVDNTNYAGSKIAEILLQTKSPIIL